MGALLTLPPLSRPDAVLLRAHLEEAEALASQWHARDGSSLSAPRIAYLLGECLRELAQEVKLPPERAAARSDGSD